ncbi:GATA transcription factor 5-like [Euphorbia lathyris]|uniref:GATA transcription factor 5-like n=1 Tax=Euphorbia lathyris TaxID=212925 RepID=UPI0033143BE8
MECVEAALKTNIRKEMAFKFSPQVFFDDLCLQNVPSSDDFIVDELLDFSNEGGFIGEEEERHEKSSIPSVSAKLEVTLFHEGDKISDHTSDFSAGELGVPADDLASLEWLSHFVEDSNSEYSTPFPAGVSSVKPKQEGTFVPVLTEPCFRTPVPAKARSKRTRTGVRVWSLGSPSLTAEPSSSSSSSTSYSAPSSPYLICTTPGMTHDSTKLFSLEKPPLKKQKKRLSGDGCSQPPRRCSHCGVQKTPQWRTGPLGAKTLCNACGVRYKSGRLLPEYRPACSPTFSVELHSNHHRKVLEMRKQKESPVLDQAEPGLAASAVPSFG